MHLPFSLLLCMGAILTTSLAQTNATQTKNIEVTCLRFPESIAGNGTFNTQAIRSLSQALEDNSFNPPLPVDGIKLKPGYATRIGWGDSGGYQICVQNFWFFKTLSIDLQTLSEVVSMIGDTCCDASITGRGKNPGDPGRYGQCQDATALVQATDGSGVKVVPQDYGDRCCGMYYCS